MAKKQNLLFGTLLLSAASFISRLCGFSLRIFLSHTFTAEQIGLYQLIFPIYALCFSMTSAGIELALSRSVAKEISLGNKKTAIFFLYISLFISLLLSVCSMKTLQRNASFLAIHILGDLRCETLIMIISRALPFASIHSCVCGYYLGLKQAKITAISQLVEQGIRVASTILLCQTCPNILFAVHGIVLSEFFSALFCIWYYSHHDFCLISREMIRKCFQPSKELLTLAIPITANRVLSNLLQNIESISIPLCLQKYGYTNSESLGIFGVLTGMVLPCILFPSAVTNAIATQLLPTVAELQSKNNQNSLYRLVKRVLLFCVLLGSSCCILLFISSDIIGLTIFHSSSTADFLKVLCWICPFLYTNATLSSVINGLGKTHITFIISCLCMLIRITAIILFIPNIGIKAYLLGLLFSQFLAFILNLLYLAKRGC